MDYKAQLEQITETVDNQKTEKIKLEERLRNLKQDKTKILSELKEQNIAEDKLEETIEELEIKIQTKITEANNLLK